MPTVPLPQPDSLLSFARTFSTEEACQDYIFKLRWPDGFSCPECGTDKFWWSRTRRLVICSNNHQTHLTAGTILQDSKQPLVTWFYAAYLTSTLTPGISAVQLQKQLGIKSYETAWALLHKLRSAMVNPEREGLRGAVEMDETYIGGAQPGAKGGRSTEQKTLVVAAVERVKSEKQERGFRAGRIRLCSIPEATSKELLAFAKEHVQAGSTIRTDGWPGYSGLVGAGYKHVATTIGNDPAVALATLPLVHLEFSNLKTWLAGTYHARQERQHLQAYLNEFAFRHNRRFWKFSAFRTILRIGVGMQPLTYEELYDTDEFGRSAHVCALPGEEGGASCAEPW